MKLLLDLLKEELIKRDHFIIYGTGNYAKEFMTVIHDEEDICNKILAFTVSRPEENTDFYGYPVKKLEKIECDKVKVSIIVTIAQKTKIVELLESQGYKDILCLTDFIVDNLKHVRDTYVLLSYPDLCKCILSENGLEISEYDAIVNRKNKLNSYDRRQIVFIEGNYSPRIKKQVNALARKGFYIVLILYGSCAFENVENDFLYDNIEIRRCERGVQMIYAAMEYNPYVYHFSPDWGNLAWLEVMIRNKENFRPIAVELYDVLNAGYSEPTVDTYQLECERYCLENSDGIVWRWYAKELLEKKGFRFAGSSIHFSDYCSGALMFGKQAAVGNRGSNKIRLCMSSGDISGWDINKTIRGFSYFASLSEIVEKIGNDQGCVLDVYTLEASKEYLDFFEKTKSKYNNIRFIVGKKHSDFLSELSQYDYACEFFTGRSVASDDLKIEIGGRTMLGSNLKCCMANRWFDYIDAGLPIITVNPSQTNQIFKQAGALIEMTLDNFDINYLKKHKIDYKKNASDLRNKLLIDNHINELISLFDELSVKREQVKTT